MAHNKRRRRSSKRYYQFVEGFEVWFRQWIHKRGRGRSLLTLPSWLYGVCVNFRHSLYDRGIYSKKKLQIPVVSVGNLVAGGTGKTQLSLLLAKQLKRRVAIVSRGYRSDYEKSKRPLFVNSKIHTPRECGDEPWLLAEKLPETTVVVCKDRYAGALKAEEKGAEIIVLDDGMQHRRLHRDVEIIVIDGTDPYGGGHFLPKGLLREDPKRLVCADLIMVIEASSSNLDFPFTKAPCVYGRIAPKRVVGVDMDSLKGASVGVFCGIGNPYRFVNTVEESLGAKVVASYFTPDHRPIGKKELERFALKAKKRGAEILLCTEKDKVKLPVFTSPLPIGWVEVTVEIFKNEEAWENLLTKINQLVR